LLFVFEIQNIPIKYIEIQFWFLFSQAKYFNALCLCCYGRKWQNL